MKTMKWILALTLALALTLVLAGAMAIPEGTTPSAKDAMTYTGENQGLCNDGEGDTYQYQYKVSTDTDYSEWSAEVPQAANAGSYDIQWQSTTDTESRGYLQATIQPATISVSNWPTAEVTYTGSAPADPSGGTVTGGSASDYQVAWSWVNTSDVWNAGQYPAKATITINSEKLANYTHTQSPFEITADNKLNIKKVELTATVSWDNFQGVYDGNPHGTVVSLGTDGPTATATVGGQSTQTNVGSYDVVATLDSAYTINYEITSTTPESLTINPAQLTATVSWAGGFDGTYDGQSHAAAVSLTGAAGTDTPTATATVGGATNQTNAGTYTVVATLDSTNAINNNYEITSTTPESLTIDRCSVTFSWTNAGPFTYSGETRVPTVTVVGVISPDTCDATFETTGPDTASKKKGEYIATVKSLSNPNYTFDPDGTTVSQNYVIEQLVAELQWADQAQLTYNGKNQYPQATVSNLVSGDSCDVTVEATDAVHVGPYSAIATGLSNDNYKLPGTVSCLKTFSIVPLTATLTWENTEFPFDGDMHLPTATVSNLQTNDAGTKDDCDVTVTGEQKNAGTYTAEATDLSNGDYVLGDEKSTQFTIKEADISKATIGSIDNQTYTGSAIEPKDETTDKHLPVITDDATGTLAEGTDYSLSYSANKNAGTATITITGLGNYAGSSTTTTFKIDPKPVTLTWTDPENATILTPFAYTYNGTVQTPVATVTVADGLVAGDECPVVVTFSPEDSKKIGNYTATGALDTTVINYMLKEGYDPTQAYTISPKTATLAWTWQDPYTYNGQEQWPTVEVTNLCQGDTCKVTIEEADARVPLHTGDYTAEATALDNDNYVLPEDDTIFRAFTIAPLTAVLEWSDLEFEYDTEEHLPTAVVTNLIGEDECAVIVEKKEKNQGTYTAKAVELVNDFDDYALPEVTTQGWAIYRKKVAPIVITVNGSEHDTHRLGGPAADKYHTISIAAEANEKMTVTVTKGGAAVTTINDFTAGTITITNDAINGAALDGSGDVEYTVTAVYVDQDNLTNDEVGPDAKPAPSASDTFIYDTTVKPITVAGLYNRGQTAIKVTLPEGYRKLTFKSSGAGQDFDVTKEEKMPAGTTEVTIGNLKLNSTEKYGSSYSGTYEDYVGNSAPITGLEILQAGGTLEIVSVEPPINNAGRIGNTPSLTFTVRMSAPGGFAETVNFYGQRTLSQGEQQVVIPSSSMTADGTNSPNASFDDLTGAANFRSFVYDPVCDEPILTIAPYAGEYYLIGLAEPYSHIVVEVNGERIAGSADAFGVFALKLPIIEEGMTITMRVTDQADNVITKTWTVGPELDDITMDAFMGGRLYTNAHGAKPGETPDWAMALSVSVEDLKAGKVNNIPIFAGNMISVGTISVKMDDSNRISYECAFDDGIEVLSEKMVLNRKPDRQAIIAMEGFEISTGGTAVTDLSPKATVYLTAKFNVKVSAEKLKETFQTEKIKDSDLKKIYRNLQNGKLN